MDQIIRDKITAKTCEGAVVKEVFGPEGYIKENEAKMGFMTLKSDAAGKEFKVSQTEVYYVENASGACVCYGDATEALEKDDVLVVGKDDSYGFVFENEESFVDLVYFIPTVEQN